MAIDQLSGTGAVRQDHIVPGGAVQVVAWCSGLRPTWTEIEPIAGAIVVIVVAQEPVGGATWGVVQTDVIGAGREHVRGEGAKCRGGAPAHRESGCLHQTPERVQQGEVHGTCGTRVLGLHADLDRAICSKGQTEVVGGVVVEEIQSARRSAQVKVQSGRLTNAIVRFGIIPEYRLGHGIVEPVGNAADGAAEHVEVVELFIAQTARREHGGAWTS